MDHFLFIISFLCIVSLHPQNTLFAFLWTVKDIPKGGKEQHGWAHHGKLFVVMFRVC
jgi:hypothetical protein